MNFRYDDVDKCPLDYLTISRRRSQFQDAPVALTNAPTFAEKAGVFPGVTFVVGVDTAARIVAARYTGDRWKPWREAHVQRIRDAGCTFLVAGRAADGRFLRLAEIEMPAEFADLFTELPEEAFRLDLSSTELGRGCTPTSETARYRSSGALKEA